MSTFLKFSSRFLPIRKWRKKLRKHANDFAPRNAYSQEGEDLLLMRILGSKNTGYYVDVGAHHPFRFSNTAIFYLKGWRGINVDPRPGTKQLFDRHRPRDVNVECGVAETPGRMSYYMYTEPALNTFDPKEVSRHSSNGVRFQKTLEVPVRRLCDIICESKPRNTNIDFISIDCEGMDLSVLRSNDFEAFRPRVIICEGDADHGSFSNSEIIKFLNMQGYVLYANTVKSYFFIESSCPLITRGDK